MSFFAYERRLLIYSVRSSTFWSVQRATTLSHVTVSAHDLCRNCWYDLILLLLARSFKVAFRTYAQKFESIMSLIHAYDRALEQEASLAAEIRKVFNGVPEVLLCVCPMLI
jgi:hypothetical protein